jgi:hypothetical protein
MAIVFSTNNRYQGLGSLSKPTFCQAWFDLKEFLKSAPGVNPGDGGPGWKVVQSGIANSVAGDSFKQDATGVDGDCITSADNALGGMAGDSAWFVIEDPAGKRQLLFYRNVALNMSGVPGCNASTQLRTAAGLVIAYSALGKFSLTRGHGGAAVSASNPPIAEDMIWLHQQDSQKVTDPLDPLIYLDSVDLPNYQKTSFWCGAADTAGFNGESSYPSADYAIKNSDMWNLHICVEQADLTVPPVQTDYGMYFWISGKETTYGFFALDTIKANKNADDNDGAVIWYVPEYGGVGGRNSRTDATKKWSMNQQLNTGVRIRSWSKLPAAPFVDRKDFYTQIASGVCRFMPTTVVFYSGVFETPLNMMPGLSTTLNTAKDFLAPIQYFKVGYPENDDGSAVYGIPNSYKGISKLFKLECVYGRKEFDTPWVAGTRDMAITGNERLLTIPWSGSLINQA